MLFVTETVKNEEVNKLNNFFIQLNNEFDAVNTIDAEEEIIETTSQKYINSLVTSQYQKSVEAIRNTVIGNKRRKKRNLQQVMQE
ncbi:hypothetical protein IJD34_04615, partial [bacterium]|nr:hypothetical protein [bacterium]